MKKVIALVACFFMVLSVILLVGCGKTKNNNEEANLVNESNSLKDKLHNIKYGDTIQMGKYNDKPISWKVANVQYNKAFIICTNEYIDEYDFVFTLFPKKVYDNTGLANITWETSTIRNWLNKDIYNDCFSQAERSIILNTENKTADKANVTYYNFMSMGNSFVETTDRIFLPSIEDYRTYKDIIFTDDDKMYFEWLRETTDGDFIQYNNWSSTFYVKTENEKDRKTLESQIRPAMWISLE